MVVKDKRQVSCPSCGRIFGPGTTWFGANHCRAYVLLLTIAQTPGLSTAELSERTGLSYGDALRGMEKARADHWVDWDTEERAQGGQRYRYRVEPASLRDFEGHLHRVEEIAATKS